MNLIKSINILFTLPFICVGCNHKYSLNWSHIDYNPEVIRINSTLTHTDDANLDKAGARKLFGASYIAKNDTVIPYRIYRPTEHTNRKLPLVLMMHGAGEHGTDNKKQLTWCTLSTFEKYNDLMFNSIVIVPQSFDDDWTWIGPHTPKQCYRENIAETRMLDAVFDLVRLYSELPFVDEHRIYVVGLSAGGYAVWELIAKHPNFFAAGIPMSSGGPLHDEAINIFKNTPIYAFHGDQDKTIPYSTGTPLIYEKIKNAGGDKIIFKTYVGGGHNIWDNAINFEGDGTYPNTLNWLFGQKR